MWRNILRLFVADTCYGCDNELTSQEEFVCWSCLTALEATDFHLRPTENELFYRLAGKVPLHGAASLAWYDKAGLIQGLIRHLKYEQAPRLAVFLGQYYGTILAKSGFLEDIEAIVPVPLHRMRQLSRGYNQAEMIASGMSEETALALRTDLLYRSRATKSQARTSGQGRWDNVSKAFKTKGHWPKGILLVDDVITTGATLESCIRAMVDSTHPPKIIRIASLGLAR